MQQSRLTGKSLSFLLLWNLLGSAQVQPPGDCGNGLEKSEAVITLQGTTVSLKDFQLGSLPTGSAPTPDSERFSISGVVISISLKNSGLTRIHELKSIESQKKPHINYRLQAWKEGQLSRNSALQFVTLDELVALRDQGLVAFRSPLDRTAGFTSPVLTPENEAAASAIFEEAFFKMWNIPAAALASGLYEFEDRFEITPLAATLNPDRTLRTLDISGLTPGIYELSLDLLEGGKRKVRDFIFTVR
jgi:hypothetical protein